MKVLISEFRLPQIGNLAVRYLKYRILIGKISGLRWYYTKRGRKFYFAQTSLDDSPTFLFFIQRTEISLFLLVFHLRENFDDMGNSQFWQFLRVTHLLRRISPKVGKQQVREFQTSLTIIFSRCWDIYGLEKKISNLCCAHLNFGICIFLTTWWNLVFPQPTQRWRRITLISQHLEKHVRNKSWKFKADWVRIFWEILRRKLNVGKNDENRVSRIWAFISQNWSFLV